MDEFPLLKDSTNEILLEDINKMYSSTLIRAAKVSSSIKDGRTIGPIEIIQTLKKCSEVKEQQVKKNHKEIREQNKTNTVAECSNIQYNFNIPQKNDLLDFNIINNSIAVKASQKSRKDSIKKEISQRLIVLTAENKKRKELAEKSHKIQDDWMKRKIENDKEIYEVAEKYIEDEILRNNKKHEKILNDKQRRLQTIVLEAIVQRRKKFTSHYEKVCQSLKLEKNFVDCEEYNKNLKELAIDFENLIQKIKNNNIGQSEIVVANSLCERIENLNEKLCSDINNKRKASLSLATQAQSTTQNYESSIHQQEEKSLPNPNSNNVSDAVDNKDPPFLLISMETWNFYSTIVTYFNEKIQSLAPLENDPSMKKFLAACRRKINIPVAAICGVSPEHMQDKFDKIMNFILGNNKKQTTSDVHVSEHPLARDYCIRYLAKKFVDVAGTEISSNSQAAFPFASIIIAIWNCIPEFGKLFLGQMYTESVFLVPFLFPKSNFQNDVQYKLAYGYYLTENGSSLEEFSSYNKRQAGIVRLFAAIMISHGKRGDQNHPFPIENGWKWLSNLINIKPEMHDIISTIIVEYLQIAAYEMLSLYGNQFKKVLNLIQEKYLPKLNEIEDGKAASKGKLEQVLDLILKHNHIDRPLGTIEKNFW